MLQGTQARRLEPVRVSVLALYTISTIKHLLDAIFKQLVIPC